MHIAEWKTIPTNRDLLQTLWAKQGNVQRTVTGFDGSADAIKTMLRVDQKWTWAPGHQNNFECVKNA